MQSCGHDSDFKQGDRKREDEAARYLGDVQGKDRENKGEDPES